MRMPPEYSPLLSRKEVACFLNVTTRTVARWELNGTLKPIRLSRRAVRYNLCDIQRFVVNGQISQKEGA